MKVNILLNEAEKMEGYENIPPQNIQSLIDGSCELLECNSLLELNPNIFQSLLPKVRHGGIISLTILDIHRAVHNLYNKIINTQEFSQILNGRNMVLSLEDLKGIVAQTELDIVNIDHVNYIYSVQLRRR